MQRDGSQPGKHERPVCVARAVGSRDASSESAILIENCSGTHYGARALDVVLELQPHAPPVLDFPGTGGLSDKASRRKHHS